MFCFVLWFLWNTATWEQTLRWSGEHNGLIQGREPMMRWHKNWKENAFAGAEITAREMIWHCKTWGTEGDRAVKGVRSYRQKVWTKAAWWHKYYFTFNKDHLTRLLALEVDQCVASKEDWGQQDSFIAFYSFIFQKKIFFKKIPSSF